MISSIPKGWLDIAQIVPLPPPVGIVGEEESGIEDWKEHIHDVREARRKRVSYCRRHRTLMRPMWRTATWNRSARKIRRQMAK